MFNPKYTITPQILKNLKDITLAVSDLNRRHFPHIILAKLEHHARELSDHTSTSIEGNPLGLTEVRNLLKTNPKNLRDSEREITNYNDALIFLKELLDQKKMPVSAQLILKVHQKVMNKLMPKFNCGKWRKAPVWIFDPKTKKPVFLPPDHDEVKKLMDDLIHFVNLNINELDPIVVSAIFHKQMVLIHPFMDGNGRTTRLCTKILLAHLGLNTFNLFSFENFYSKNITRYFKTVGEKGNYYEIMDKIDFTSWIEYFSEGIIDELLRVKKELDHANINPANILEKHHELILKTIREKGYINDKIYSQISERAKATRALDFKKLIELGIIERDGKGKNTIYKMV